MNLVILKGRATRDAEVKQSASGMVVASYTLAVDRNSKEKATDFISCKAFDKSGQFAEKYVKKGTEIIIQGHIQTGSYDGKDGKKVYTTDVIVDRHEFCGSKADNVSSEPIKLDTVANDGFVPVNTDSDLEELPFM